MLSFFDRNRKELERRGIDPARLPPGQYFTDRFPVLHAGSVPVYRNLDEWNIRFFGHVANETTLGFDELMDLGTREVTTDIHCVTKWSKFDTVWQGVPMSAVIDLVKPEECVTHVIVHSEYGFSTNLPYEDVTSQLSLLATHFDGEPLEPDHGYPVRFFLPHLYFWKSAKWVRAIEFSDKDRPGFWERNGYHNYGDPWREQRYWE